jgi:hypothetical protein
MDCWNDMKAFVRDVANSLELGRNEKGQLMSRVALVTFASNTKVEFGLNSEASSQATMKRIMQTKGSDTVPKQLFNRPHGSTMTGSGMTRLMADIEPKMRCRTAVFSSGQRCSTKRAMLVITDGQHDTSSNPARTARDARKTKNMVVFAVGICKRRGGEKDADYTTRKRAAYNRMKELVGGNDAPPALGWEKRVKIIDDFGGLEDFVDKLSDGLCDPPPPPPVEKCYTPVDLAFAVDVSGSIQDDCKYADKTKCWSAMSSFVRGVSGRFDIGTKLEQARVGLVKFGTTAETVFKLKEKHNIAQVRAAISAIEYKRSDPIASYTQHRKALEELRDSVMLEPGMRGQNLKVPRVVVIVTDGKTTAKTGETKGDPGPVAD